ncbi:heterokaryon incompatibility protein [Hypoxylon cercidicola]|nr:heterokaryon incompatibility protein [Hypoxylon cercidicola]
MLGITSGATTVAKLGNDIEYQYKKNRYGSRFLPEDLQHDLVTKRTVHDVLRNARIYDAKSLADFVLDEQKPAKKLFLILVLMSEDQKEKLSLLANLKRSKITDESLPIQFGYDTKKNRSCWYSLEYDNQEKKEFYGEWTRRDLDALQDTYQWRFLAPVFGGNKFHFNFDDQRILPYLPPDKDETDPEPAAGFFSEVRKVEIYEAHLDTKKKDTNTKGIPVAIKKAKHGGIYAKYFDKEASNLYKLTKYRSSHLIKPIAAYRQREERCLVFLWADGGNLQEYWKNHEDQREEVDSLRWLLGQLEGICDAVKELHDNNTRHGDLKPQNILWFKDGNHGDLQIADLGLTTFHEEERHTLERKGEKTRTPPGTSRYEPPETHEKQRTDEHTDEITGGELFDTRSRQYDIWSLGCVLLESLLWLIYGYQDVQKFQTSTRRFWQYRDNEYFVDPYVDSCMEETMSILKDDSAYKDLLSIVQKRLLVIKVSETYKSLPDCRETANVLHEKILHIVNKCKKGVQRSDGNHTSSYLRPITSTYPTAKIQHKATQRLQVPQREDAPSSSSTRSPHHDPSTDRYDDSSLKVIVHRATGDINSDSLSTNASTNTMHQQSCGLCNLLFEALGSAGIIPPKVVILNQEGATVRIKDGPKLLSIYVEPDSTLPEGVQSGLPKLLEPASEEQFALLNQWIEVCDSNHDECHRKNEKVSTMPTRLIEVGDRIRLIDSVTMSPSLYVALSHCWGPIEKNTKFCTFKSNIDDFKKSIELSSLPPLFRDAIRVVRGLGLKYIWIDSLCIIQDDDQDWKAEAGRMEQVFSGASFTIAPSSAKSSNEEFLSPRSPRRCVQLYTQNAGRVYVCPNIDNFHKDVELGELNRRGWVFQERVLSRRSIYFSSTQIYWECGVGVHCETLTRLKNSKSGFLGDSNFPESALKHYRDGRQILIQDLYERYSGLAFTKVSDRSMAILGLQKRLAQAFRTQAAFGLLADYFGRGLLWKRRDASMMKRISWPSDRPVPSWSWLSKEGPIQYMNLQFEKIDWATSEFKVPFPPKKPSDGGENIDPTMLWGRARKLLHHSELDMLVRITFDDREEFDAKILRCVVIGKDKAGSGTDELKLHVLVIHPLTGPEKETYERVGVASLRPEHVGDETSWVAIR